MASGDLSLTSTSSQEEVESSEYAAYERSIRPSSNSSASAGAPNNTNSNGTPISKCNTNTTTTTKKFDIMKTQYDSAVMELAKLRHQHSDTVRRCDDLSSQLAFFQDQYMAALNQIKNTDRNNFTDIASENAQLKQQNSILERKLMHLIESVNKPDNENNPLQTSKNVYYCDYGDVSARKCDGSCTESEKLMEELQLCKERNSDLMKEHNVIIAEREKYKKSFSSAIMELENIKKERNFYRDSREQFNIQREQMEKEIEKLKTLIAAESNKVLMITIQRSRIEEELNQLLSEKDNVLQEHQKMSDDLVAANKELDKLRKDELILKNEIKALQQPNSEFKRRDLLKSRESSWSKEFSDMKDDSKEVEKLHKSLEKALAEVERALQDTEEAKRVRDWAISQREKIVQERDSVKTLCDNLRKERDKAISDLLSAIRDSEKIKKQKEEAQKKIDILKEQIENQNFECSSRRSFRMSAYEADDLFEIELCNYHADSDLGIILDDTNNRQLVCGVTNISPAFGKLKINDVICKVNDLDCQSMPKRLVLDKIRTCAPRCNLLVSRTRHSKRHFYTVQLNLLENHNHGLVLETGVFISNIEPNSLASFQPELDIGDRILSINNKSMEGMQSKDIMSLVNDDRKESITIFALKNIQDVCFTDVQRRTTTSSAQTDSMDSMHRITNPKHPSKIAEMLSKFKEKIHISKPGTDVDNFTQESDALAALDSVLSENSSEKSKENLFKRSKRNKKVKEAAAKSMGTWPRTNILNSTHENSTATIVHREKKRAPLSLFTAGPINVDKEDDHGGNSVEPLPLPPPVKQQNVKNVNNLVKKHQNRNSNPVPSSLFYQNSSLTNPGNVYSHYMRHSVYGTPTTLEQEPVNMEPTKLLQRPLPLMGANMRVKIPPGEKHINQRSYQNRYSLNITPTELYKTSGQQAQQQVLNSSGGAEVFSRKQHLFDTFHNSSGSTNTGKSVHQQGLFVPLNANAVSFPRNGSGTQQNSLDMISLKSQNSIDSILSAKSPPISEYGLSNYPKRGLPIPQPVVPVNIKNVSKYPSDSESIASGIIGISNVGVGGGMLCSNNLHQNRHNQLFPTFTQAHPHTHPIRQIRHSSPLTLPSPPAVHSHPHGHHISSTLPQTEANDSSNGIPTNSIDKFEMDYMPSAHSLNPHGFLHDYPVPSQHQHQETHHLSHVVGGNDIFEGGTFPRKKDHQRFRIPSNPSVGSKTSAAGAVLNSSGSIDHFSGNGCNAPTTISTATPYNHHSALVSAAANGFGSGRGSPMPQVHVEVLSHGGSKRNSNTPTDFLFPGDLRRVTIEKSDKSLGITIQCNNNGGGIFVSTVAEKSIATRAGLQVGDQLLEVCGLNMRSATNDIAANVLRQCGNSITMLVQYNPEKFHSTEYEGTNNIEAAPSVNHSGSPTPRNSPRPPVRDMMNSLPPMPLSLPPPNSILPHNILGSPTSLISTQSIKEDSFAGSLGKQSYTSSSQDLPSSTATTASITSAVYEEDARYITLRMDKSKNLGIKLFGGNKVGIYVYDVHPGSPSDHAGVRKGDQILEYNGVDLRCVTAEQAANEISKLTDTVTMLVQNKYKKLKQIKDKSGDSFYIRTGFDRVGELNEGDLRFVKDEVLYVDNTVFGGTFGLWRAWKLDAKGHRKECGLIPSQMKVEEELRSGDSADCEGGTTRRGSVSARRSFFRRKKHQRSSSRDSTEIASFSNTQLSFFPDSGFLNEDGGILSYQRVERLDSPVRRPVLIIGPLSECVMDRLTIDFSNLFKICEVTTMDCSLEAMEEGVRENIFVDYRRRGNKFECTTIESINNSCKNDRRHCLLDISISAVERLQRLHIYPIVLLLRFKSAKQIREIRDYGTDKISAKAAKEMYERALKLENDYKQYISAVIPGVSIKHMCTQIKDSVDKEQDKLLWVPVFCG